LPGITEPLANLVDVLFFPHEPAGMRLPATGGAEGDQGLHAEVADYACSGQLP